MLSQGFEVATFPEQTTTVAGNLCKSIFKNGTFEMKRHFYWQGKANCKPWAASPQRQKQKRRNVEGPKVEVLLPWRSIQNKLHYVTHKPQRKPCPKGSSLSNWSSCSIRQASAPMIHTFHNPKNPYESMYGIFNYIHRGSFQGSM